MSPDVARRRYYQYTDDLGRLLFDRHHELVGRGSGTLVFRWDTSHVVKVPHDRQGRACRSKRERRWDLVNSKRYPRCFAETRLVHLFASGRTYQAVIQETLAPFSHKGDPTPKELQLHVHPGDIEEFIDMQLNLSVREYGVDLSGRLKAYDYR